MDILKACYKAKRYVDSLIQYEKWATTWDNLEVLSRRDYRGDCLHYAIAYMEKVVEFEPGLKDEVTLCFDEEYQATPFDEIGCHAELLVKDKERKLLSYLPWREPEYRTFYYVMDMNLSDIGRISVLDSIETYEYRYSFDEVMEKIANEHGFG